MVAVLALLPVGSALAALFGERTGYHLPLLCFGHFVARFVCELCILFSHRVFASQAAHRDRNPKPSGQVLSKLVRVSDDLS